MSNDHQEVIIHYQPIELCKLLKIANLVGGGGEAKIVITQGYVLLNGEVEFQKRKKVVSGDVIEFNGDVIKVVYQEKPKEQPKPLSNVKKQTKNKGETNVSPCNKIELKKSSRKPIIF